MLIEGSCIPPKKMHSNTVFSKILNKMQVFVSNIFLKYSHPSPVGLFICRTCSVSLGLQTTISDKFSGAEHAFEVVLTS